ncbi:MAG: hypothetical protein LWW93_05380 [Hyphomicrobiales bacterium]|nr:hypothetical protein [Hyphomicrobiales bacterium]
MFRISLGAATMVLTAALGVAAATTPAAASQTLGRDGARMPVDVVGGPIGQQCTIVTTQDPNGFIRRRRVCR